MSEIERIYIDAINNAAGDRLVEKNSLYSGKKGHERFARECGYVLNDFPQEDHKDLKSELYKVYLAHCGAVLLSEKQWNTLMESQLK